MKATARSNQGDKNIRKILKKAFWDRDVPPKKWRKTLAQGDPSVSRNIVASSFKHLPSRWLVNQIGEETFIKRWPVLREVLQNENDPIAKQRLDSWDALWGILAVGDSQHPVCPEIGAMGSKKRELLKGVIRCGICSVYDLARSVGRDYSRVYKDVRVLTESGFVSVEQKKTAQNRNVNILRARFSINPELAERARA
jgi:hypothetical protein